MKKSILFLATCLMLSAIFFTSCKNNPNATNTTNRTEEDPPIYNYQYSSDGQSYWLECDLNSLGNFSIIYNIFHAQKLTLYLDSVVINGTGLITSSKIAAWDASASSGSISTPTALASGSRVINSSTVSATSYSVATRTHLDFSGSAAINIGVLGSGTGIIYVETSSDAGTTWVRRGTLTGVAGSLIGLNTTNYGSFGVDLEATNRYRFISSTTTAGVGNTITYTFTGGSYYTY